MNNAAKFGIAGVILAAVIASSVSSLGLRDDSCKQYDSDVTESEKIRIGYFANINHAQAVIGLGRGDYQRALDGIEVKGQLFNAGPSVIEAMLAKQLDIAYVGPNPAINGYVTSEGCLLRVVAGAASGGAVFVVRNDADIETVADFANKRFSSPQLGNTQDVALRKYILDNGYRLKEDGGEVEVLPAKTSDIVTLMVKKEIDGAWVPEPWGARLVRETDSRIFLDERTLWPDEAFVTAHVIVRTDYLQENPETVKKFLEAHIEQTRWINENPEQAIEVFNEELEKLTGKTIPEDDLVEGLSRMELTYDPVKESLFQSAEDAIDIGFLESGGPDLRRIYDLDILNEILTEDGLARID